MDSTHAYDAAKDAGMPQLIDLPETRGDKSAPMIVSVEPTVKELISYIAEKGDATQIKGTSIPKDIELNEEVLSKIPGSMTGVLIHYFVRGIKQDFNIEFSKEPKSLRRGAGSRDAKRNIREMSMDELDEYIIKKKEEYLKDPTKGRILSAKTKNELLKEMDMSHYSADIESGAMTMAEVMEKIQTAYQIKKKLEDAGYILVPGVVKRPEWKLG